jgi:hypothetical protein
MFSSDNSCMFSKLQVALLPGNPISMISCGVNSLKCRRRTPKTSPEMTPKKVKMIAIFAEVN